MSDSSGSKVFVKREDDKLEAVMKESKTLARIKSEEMLKLVDYMYIFKFIKIHSLFVDFAKVVSYSFHSFFKPLTTCKWCILIV